MPSGSFPMSLPMLQGTHPMQMGQENQDPFAAAAALAASQVAGMLPFPDATQQQATKKQRVDGGLATGGQQEGGDGEEVIGADGDGEGSQAKKRRGRPPGSKSQQSGQR
eukprot:306547-Pelagomonas_calceolata.AAC.1